MRLTRFLALAVLSLWASDIAAGPNATIKGAATLKGRVDLRSPSPTLVAFRSSTGIPNSGSGLRGVDTVYAAPWPFPSDVCDFHRALTVRLGNRKQSGGLGNSFSSNVALYPADINGFATGSALASGTVTVPGDNTMATLSVAAATCGPGNRMVLYYSVPASTACTTIDNTTRGHLWDNTTTVNPPPSSGSSAGASNSAALWVEYDYSTYRPRFNGFGDSISIGSSTSPTTTPGIERSYLYLLGQQKDWAVSLWGCNASAMSDAASGGNFFSDVVWGANSTAVVEWGTNDLGAGNSATTLEANATTVYNTIHSNTTGKVWWFTVAPRGFVGAQETERNTNYNPWVRLNSLGYTGYYDAAAAQSSNGLASNSDITTLFTSFSSDGLHWASPGHIQVQTFAPFAP